MSLHGTAFTVSEQAAIQYTTVVNEDNPYYGTEGGNNTMDQVYPLSIAEVSNTAYGFNGEFTTASETREAKNTAYAEGCGAQPPTSVSYRGVGWWWLRSPGDNSENRTSATTVYIGGSVSDFGYPVHGVNIAVRPALHLNLSYSNLWKYAGKVTANVGSNIGEADPTPGNQPNTPTTDVASTPGKGSIISAKNKKAGEIVLKFKKVSGAKDYQIQYSTKKSFKGKKAKTTSKISYTIKKLKKKKTYYIRVRAYKLNGKKKVYGAWSKVKKVKVKK